MVLSCLKRQQVERSLNSFVPEGLDPKTLTLEAAERIYQTGILQKTSGGGRGGGRGGRGGRGGGRGGHA